MEDYTYEKNSVDASMHLGTQCHRTNRNTHAAPRCRHSGCRNHGYVKNGKKIITISPAKKRRQMFTSFVLTIDSATSAIKQLRMNERSGNYVNYDIK